jgi:hypothetical protein
MALISIKTDPSRRELRQFAAIWFPAFWLVVGWLSWKATANPMVVATIGSIVALVSIFGFFVPALMRPIFVGWMWAAYPIGWAVAHLLLAVIYYLVVTPIGLGLRALGRDPVQRKIDRSCNTYWRPFPADEGTARYFRQH